MKSTTAPLRRAEPAEGVLAALVGRRIPHTVVRHAELAEPVASPADVARLVGIGPDRIAKTLVVTDDSERTRCALVVLPVTARLRFRAVSAALGWRRATMASKDQLARRLGQPVDGVSPIGAFDLAVLVDTALCAGPPVLVGAGAVGVEIAIDPRSLTAVTRARCVSVSDRL